MRKFGVIVLAAVLGGIITVGIFYSLDNNGQEPAVHWMDEQVNPIAVGQQDQPASALPDFTTASRQVMDAVVHIRTSMAMQRGRGQQDIPEEFREFFERFFGPGQSPQQPQQPFQRRGSGSGVILDASGYIVTNNHVIAGADEIQVVLNNNRQYEAEVIGTDPSTDLALVKIDETDLPYARLVDSDQMEVGNWVLAIGNPFNLTSTVTAGIISATARNLNIVRDQYAIESFLQTDAAINPGNSGGALINLQGGLVGINTAIASPTGAYTGYGFAVPSNIVGKVVSDLMEFGVVQRGYLGVMIRNVDADFAEEENLDVAQGVYVDSVLENSAAEEADLRVGDVIISIEGNEINRTAQLQATIATHRPGEEIEMVVNRNGRRVETTAVLKSREGETTMTTEPRAEVLGRLGVELENIDRQTERSLGIDGGVKVIRLHRGILSRFTDMREGFIITRVNNQPVGSVQDFIQMMEGHRGGVMLEGVYEDVEGTYYYAFGL